MCLTYFLDSNWRAVVRSVCTLKGGNGYIVVFNIVGCIGVVGCCSKILHVAHRWWLNKK